MNIEQGMPGPGNLTAYFRKEELKTEDDQNIPYKKIKEKNEAEK